MEDYKAILDKATSQASEFINNPPKLNSLLDELKEKLKEMPSLTETVAELPIMVNMVVDAVQKKYTISPKVLATMVGAFIYLVKKKDLIPDNIPVLGIADDVAVLGLALAFVSPDVKAYQEWKQNQ